MTCLYLHLNLCRDLNLPLLPVPSRHTIPHPWTTPSLPIQASPHPRSPTILDQELIPPCIHPRSKPLYPLPVILFLLRSLLLFFPQSRMVPLIPL